MNTAVLPGKLLWSDNTSVLPILKVGSIVPAFLKDYRIGARATGAALWNLDRFVNSTCVIRRKATVDLLGKLLGNSLATGISF
ncbi:hypothetical protein Tco_0860425 [Tanacetum coccineum]|uniref:Uncharacterized protein n=1 Tax=Tanacetum coccineum TaxID=301880 RepID=A0ABQ5BIQ0_9ASTR